MRPKIVGAVWKNKSKGTPWRGPLRELAGAGRQSAEAQQQPAGPPRQSAAPLRQRAAAATPLLLAAQLTAAAAFAVVAAQPAAAQGARVTASPATADPEFATTLSLRGTGFQSVKNGYGGIYVFFGWVDGAWQPSRGGASGSTMRYVQDREAKDNNGYQRFISFPGGETEHAANGVVNADGTWSAQLNVPGAKFKAAGRDGAVSEVDCTTVTCGVITIGAHGVVNANNETFTPISFAIPNQPVKPPPAPTTTTTPPVTTTTTTTTTTATATTTTTTTQPEVHPAAQASPDNGRPGWLIPGGIGAAVLLAAVLVWWLRFRRGKTNE